MDAEILQSMMFSPPFFIAWGFGYISDMNMLLALFLMIMPVGVNKAVAALGGRGAWRKKEKAKAKAAQEANRASRRSDAKGNPLPPPVEETEIIEHFKLPTSVWAPPVMLLFYTRDEAGSDFNIVSSAVAVYVTMIAGQYTLRKMGLLKS